MGNLIMDVLETLFVGIVSIYTIAIDKLIIKVSENKNFESYSQNIEEYDIY